MGPEQERRATACPGCGTEGRPWKPITLRSLLQPRLHPQVWDEVYRFCSSPDCALVYYSADGTQTFARTDLTVRVGVKERRAPRPLCYCFGHSAESIRDEWLKTGKSTVVDSVKAEVKAGTCHCEMTNPGGGCCLGEITKEMKTLIGETDKRTVWTSIGLGVLASACCWLPLALAGLGVATGTLGARIAWIRPWALGGLLIMLLGVLGWWVRKRFASAKTQKDCCAVAPKFPSLAVATLAASFLLAWASPRIFHPGKASTLAVFAPPTPAGGTLLVISTPQFDCPACVGTLPQTMAATPGVISAQMDFDKREAHIVFQPDAAMDAIMTRWKKELGFDGKEVRREAVPSSLSGPALVQGQ